MKLLTRLKPSISSPRRQQFINLLIFYISYVWLRSFSTSVLPPHFLAQGLSFQQMIIGSIIVFTSAMVLQLVKSKYSSRNSLYLAMITFFIFILFVIKLPTVWPYYLASIFRGFTLVFFYVIYNVGHFELTPKHRTGFSSAIMFSVTPLVSLFAPLAAGFLAEINYLYVWIISGISFLLSLSLVKFQKKFTVKYNLKTGIKQLKPTRIFIFIEGAWETMIFGVIPIFSLYFIKSPFYYGTYIAYLSLMGILANLLLGKFTDKLQKRIVFLYPLTLIMAVATFLFPLALSQLLWWVVITGIIQFFVPLFWNLATALIVDTHADLRQVMPAREFILSSGRIFGFILLFLNFYLQEKPTYIFYILGSIMLLFPIILFYNTKISKKYNYL